jgi:hypothetical protein
MAKRKLLKVQDRQALFDIPTDEDSLIRHYSLSPADRLEIEVRRREHNRIGFAVQLCLMRYPGRPQASIRFRMVTPIAASECCARNERARNRGPMTPLCLPIAVSISARLP